MSTDDYLRLVIQRRKAPIVDFNDWRISDVKTIVSRWAGADLSTMKLSGSSAKGTALHGVADMDIFISLRPQTIRTLKELYFSLLNTLIAYNLPTRRQNVSLRVHTAGLEVDLVPGKIQEGYTNYHSIYKSKQDSWTQTNIDIHIQTVVNSRRVSEIILTKVWREINNLDFPSIFLELAVLEALKGRRFDELSANFWQVLNYLAESIVDVRIEDPANTNNIVSDVLNTSEKRMIQLAAQRSISKQNWNDIVW